MLRHLRRWERGLPDESATNADIAPFNKLESLLRWRIETAGLSAITDKLELFDRFGILEHDGVIVGCAALYPFADEKTAELACLAVAPEYRDAGGGEQLLRWVEDEAKKKRIKRLFVLTTRAAHWFIEHGFREAGVNALPKQKQALYNYQRRSKVLIKAL